MARGLVLLAVLANAVAACGGDAFEGPTGAAGATAAAGGSGGSAPVDVSGTYTADIKDKSKNDCKFGNWMNGQEATGIPVVITEDGGVVTAVVSGGTGLVLDATLGTRTFTGAIGGTTLAVVAHGTKATKNMGCSYTINATVTVTVTGDAIQGIVDYASVTNGSEDCKTTGIEGCQSEQSISGVRPPS